MSDVCCAHDDAPVDPAAAVQRLRDVREIQLSLLAGLALAAGLIAELTSADAVGLVAFAVAIVVGGLTFIPRPRGRCCAAASASGR
ncbi:MAG: hypothetical protein R2736_01925 [Solirubrobacterales bacterium]